MKNGCSKVILSTRAHLAVVAETYERVSTETGGILLGTVIDDIWYVIEVIDPGPNSIFRPTYFEYDTPYVNHLSNKIARLYQEEIQLLGLWHRHPGSFDSFSSTDDGTNTKYAMQNPKGAISAIVNLDPRFRMSAYHVTLPLQYDKIPVCFGDALIPSHLLTFKTFHDLLPTQRITDPHSVTGFRATLHDGSQPKVAENFFGSVGKFVSQLLSSHPQPEGKPQNKAETRKSENEADKIAEVTPQQEAVLKMLDNEMTYLEAQPDYTYAISMRNSEVHINLTRIQELLPYPRALNCILAIEHSGPCITINGHRVPYRSGMIYEYINGLVAEAAPPVP